jgi:hypothetical protein
MLTATTSIETFVKSYTNYQPDSETTQVIEKYQRFGEAIKAIAIDNGWQSPRSFWSSPIWLFFDVWENQPNHDLLKVDPRSGYEKFISRACKTMEKRLQLPEQKYQASYSQIPSIQWNVYRGDVPEVAADKSLISVIKRDFPKLRRNSREFKRIYAENYPKFLERATIAQITRKQQAIEQLEAELAEATEKAKKAIESFSSIVTLTDQFYWYSGKNYQQQAKDLVESYRQQQLTELSAWSRAIQELSE